MRTTNRTARGIPLAVLLLMLACLSWAVLGEGNLRIDQTIRPDEIYVIGMDEEPSAATLVLTLTATGPTYRYPIDCLFVIDVSATSDLSQARQFALDLVSQLGVDDRAGLISYGTTAQLDMPLTHNLGAVQLALADLVASGKSAMGLGMQMARNEFEQAGREDAIYVEVLISDGQSSVGPKPDAEGAAAATLGIKIMSVGLGTLINRNMLEAFADETGGEFFASPSDNARTDIFGDLDVSVAAGGLRVEKRLPRELRLAGATPEATQVELRPDGTTAIWRLGDLELGESVTIEMEIEAVEVGDWETDRNSTIYYTDFRGVDHFVALQALPIACVLPNEAPTAAFTVASEAPLDTVDPVHFEDASVDFDGDVVAWEWDFGDGTTSTERNPQHRFMETGTATISLVAIDEDGARSEPYEAEVAVELGPRVTVTRTIDTCIPGDQTVPERVIHVVLLISIDGFLNGMTVVETFPDGWTFFQGENDTASIRYVGETNSAEWLFAQKLGGEAVDVQREIRYTLQAPPESVLASELTREFSIAGTVGSSSPRFSQPVVGEDKIALTNELPIPVVVARLAFEADQPVMKLCEPNSEVVEFAELQDAVALWLRTQDREVPYTGGRTIDVAMMQDLVAYWLTGRSVHDPLP
jgi:PKD repeat protein